MSRAVYPLALLQQVFTLAVCVRDSVAKMQISQTSISQALMDKAQLLPTDKLRDNKLDELQRLELRSLIESANWTVCGELQFTLKKVHPGRLLGVGQIESIVEQIFFSEQEIQQRDGLAEALDFVVIDYELSPTQLFNLEKILKKPVIDRQALILTLFEQRAQTREAHLQVHLARLYYEKPRLKRAWTHLSRQRGGRYGNRGEGETQIEIDGRLIHNQIRKLESQIAQVQKRRACQRKRASDWPHIALVGYTNAGKSALMHALSDTDVYVADRLFATLDPKSSELKLPKDNKAIVTDTVGFVRKLPHELINAFRATLEEIVLADLQLLVLDASDMEWQEKLATVHRVLQELGVNEKASILLLNKADLLSPEQSREMQALFPQAVLISAKQRLGLDALMAKIGQCLCPHDEVYPETYVLEVPHEAGALRAWLYEQKLVSQELECSDNGQLFYLSLSNGNLQKLSQQFPQVLGSLQLI